MAVPSRAFVGILVFGLIACLAVIPFTFLVLSGYQPPPDAPHKNLFPEPQASSPGSSLVLVLASLFCVAVVVSSWRGLVNGARLDRQLRQERERDSPKDEQPPGYQ